MRPNHLPAANRRRPFRFLWVPVIRCFLASSLAGPQAAAAEGGRSTARKRENDMRTDLAAALTVAVLAVAVNSGNSFQITSLSGDGALSWTNFPGATRYRVEWAPNLSGCWTNISDALSAIPGTGLTYTVQVPMDVAQTSQFYRVAATIPDVGADYHAYGTDFLHTAFITIYDQPMVRQTVRDQLQGMADRGATRISTRIWFVTEPGTTNFGETWRATFPMTDQEQTNLHVYAQDVAAVQGSGGSRLRLDLGMLWLGAADYTRGTPATGLGWTPISGAVFTNRVNTTTDKLLAAVTGVSRPDAVPVVETIYLNGEVMIGAKANEDWFMTAHYPRFVSAVTQAGFTPSVYFIVADSQDHVLQNDYSDPQYPILNNHRSMFWVFRTLRFMADNGLSIPARTDFWYYVPSSGATYTQLLTRVLDDADATLPTLGAAPSYALAETYYFADDAQRKPFGQAIAQEMAARQRLKLVTFWTTPDGGGAGTNIAYPFAFEDYRLTPGNWKLTHRASSSK